MSRVDEIRERWSRVRYECGAADENAYADDVEYLLSQLKDGGAEGCAYCDSSLGCAEHDNNGELQQLRREFEMSGVGDRPSSISAAKLRRLIQLERTARATAPTGGSDQCGKWLGYAKSELECHVEWWTMEGDAPHYKARAAQASALISDIEKVLAGTSAQVFATESAASELAGEQQEATTNKTPRWCLACGAPTCDLYCSSCTDSYRAMVATPVAQPESHNHNCPNCFHFFDCAETECATNYSASCPECNKKLDGVAQPEADPVDDTMLRGSVEITVFRGAQILAVNSRNFDGFCGVGGKVEPGESFEQAARRELMEETGCEARLIDYIAGHTLDPIKGDDTTVKWYCAGFVVDIGDQEPRPTEPGTTPFWTTKENMIQNSLFPEWYSWWFRVLDRFGFAPSTTSPSTAAQDAAKEIDADAILRSIVETVAGERIRMKCGAADLRSVITDVAAIISKHCGGEAEQDVEAAWKEVQDSLNREGEWTAGETGTFHAFFVSGWNNRGMASYLAHADEVSRLNSEVVWLRQQTQNLQEEVRKETRAVLTARADAIGEAIDLVNATGIDHALDTPQRPRAFKAEVIAALEQLKN